MKKLLFALSVLVFTSASAQDADYVKQNYVKKEVYIQMRDGVKLFTSILRPQRLHQNLPYLVSAHALLGSALRCRQNKSFVGAINGVDERRVYICLSRC